MYCDLKFRGVKRKYSSSHQEDQLQDDLDEEDHHHHQQQQQDHFIKQHQDLHHNQQYNIQQVEQQQQQQRTPLQDIKVHNKSNPITRNGTHFIAKGSDTSSPPPPPSTKANSFSTAFLNNLTANKFDQTYARLRQIIFNISMFKLSRYRQTLDPCLLRSVLICNTLKRLEKELEKEGVKINFGPTGVSFSPAVNNTQNGTLDPPPPNPINGAGENGICRTDKADTAAAEPIVNGKRSSNLSPSSGRITPFVHSSSANSDCLFEDVSTSTTATTTTSESSSSSCPSALWNLDDGTDRLSAINWSSVLNFTKTDKKSDNTTTLSTCNNTKNGKIENGFTNHGDSLSYGTITTSLHILMPPTSMSETISSTSLLINHHVTANSSNQTSSHYSAGTNDEIFGDIDLSLYDFDLLSPLSPPNIKLAPVSAEELMRSLSSESSNSSTSSSSSYLSSSSSVGSVLSNTSCSSSSQLSSSIACTTSAASTTNFQNHYFKSTEKLFADDMPTAMS